MPGCTKPSPQAAMVHALVHASVSSLLPSSHCLGRRDHAVAAVGGAQVLEHSSSSTWLPSSQPSPGPTKPSPQTLF